MSKTVCEIKARLEKLQETGPTFSLNESVVTRLLFKTTKHFEKIMDTRMQRFGLSCTSWGVLMITYDTEKNKILPSELCEILRQPKSTMTRILEELIVKKYVEREHDCIDRRKIFISITEEGKKFILDNISAHDEILKKVWNGCDIELIMNELGKAIDNMEQKND